MHDASSHLVGAEHIFVQWLNDLALILGFPFALKK